MAERGFAPDTTEMSQIRPTGFSHLQALGFMLKGHMLADTTAVLSAIDVVFGEVDR